LRDSAFPPEMKSVLPSGAHARPNQADFSGVFCVISTFFGSITISPCGLYPECSATIC